MKPSMASLPPALGRVRGAWRDFSQWRFTCEWSRGQDIGRGEGWLAGVKRVGYAVEFRVDYNGAKFVHSIANKWLFKLHFPQQTWPV